jgi:hypothetical protein
MTSRDGQRDDASADSRTHQWPNRRLYALMLAAGYRTPAVLAKVTMPSKDTIKRWLNGEITAPQDAPVADVAEALRVTAAPLRAVVTATTPTDQDIVSMWPTRAAIPSDQWAALIDTATTRLWLADDTYAFFFAPCPDLADSLNAKAHAGVDVRMLVTDARCDAIRRRGLETGEGDLLVHDALRARRALDPLAAHDPARLGVHQAALPQAMYIADDTMWISPRTYGIPSGQSPVIVLDEETQAQATGIARESHQCLWTTATTP